MRSAASERLAYPDRQAFVLAVRRQLAGSVAAEADALLDAIAAGMQEPRRAVFDRTWAERAGSHGVHEGLLRCVPRRVRSRPDGR